MTFGLGGTWYEVDLTAEEEKALEAALKKYVTVSRKAGKPTPKRRDVPETTVEERARIREWGKKEGYKFADRGRIPKEVLKAYDEAHNIDRSGRK